MKITIQHHYRNDYQENLEGDEESLREQLFQKFPFLMELPPNTSLWGMVEFLDSQQAYSVYMPDVSMEQLEHMLENVDLSDENLQELESQPLETPVDYGADPLPPGMKDLWNYPTEENLEEDPWTQAKYDRGGDEEYEQYLQSKQNE